MKKFTTVKLKKIQSGISLVSINDPKTYNSLSFYTLNSLLAVFKMLDKDNSTKVIILEGLGKGFSAGHNLKEVRGLKKRDKYLKLFNLCSKLMLQIVEGRKPVIAKVHGAAFAAGCQLVASCDLAVASEQSSFMTPGVNIGLFCSTPMVAVSRNISRKKIMEMLLTGEKLSAQEAVQFGLINKCVPLERLHVDTLNLAKLIASKPTSTVKIGKEAFYKQVDMSLDEAYHYTSEVMAINMMEIDAHEGISAFLDKRPPSWNEK